MRRIKTEGFILKKRRLLNKDLLITIFTKDYGKLEVMAKGVKTITSKRLPHLQTGNLVEAVVYKNREWNYLQETSLISAFSQIKDKQSKVNNQYFIFFVIDRVLPQDQKESKVYNHLRNFLIELSREETLNSSHVEDYINKILTDLGYLKERKPFGQLLVFIEELINEKLPLHVV